MPRHKTPKGKLLDEIKKLSPDKANEVGIMFTDVVKQERKRATIEELRRNQWLPGQSGNPKGRKPIALTLANMIRMIGEELVKDDPQINRIEAVVRALYYRAEMGSDTAASLLLERGWGKVPTLQVNVGYELIRKAQAMGIKPEDVMTSVELTEVFQSSGVNVIEGQFILSEQEDT